MWLQSLQVTGRRTTGAPARARPDPRCCGCSPSPAGEQRAVGERRQRRVLHAARDENPARTPGRTCAHGYGTPISCSKNAIMSFRVRERSAPPRSISRRRRVERQRHVAILVLQLLEITRRQRDQVVRVRFLLRPVQRHQAGRRVLLLRDLPAVGKHRHSLRHVAGDLRGELRVRGVIAREPMPVLDGLAL